MDPYEPKADLSQCVRRIQRSKKTLPDDALEDLLDALKCTRQDDAEAHALAVDVTRTLLQRDAGKGDDQDQKLRLAFIYCHVLRLEAAAADDSDVLDAQELTAVYKLLLWSMNAIKPKQEATDAHHILKLMAEGNLYLSLMDSASPAMLKDLYRSCVKIADNPQSEVWSACVTILGNLLQEGDDDTKPFLDLIVQQLTSTKPTHYTPVTKFLYAVLRQAEEAVSLPLQSKIRSDIAFETTITSRAAAGAAKASAGLQNLVHHLATAIPATIIAIVPSIALSLAGDTEADALRAVSVLTLLLSVPATHSADTESCILQHLLDASASATPALRLKVSNALATVLHTVPSRQRRDQCVKALLARVLDREAGVRAAAVRGLGEVYSITGDRSDVLDALAARLMDAVPEVRAQAVKAFVPLLARKSASMPPLPTGCTLLDAPTEDETRLVHLLETLLRALSQPANSQLLLLLPDVLSDASLVPLLSNPLATARLCLYTVTHKGCCTILRGLLDWQTKLRVLLRDLLTVRQDLAQSSPTKKHPLRAKASSTIAALLAHYLRVVPKNALSAGALQQLLEQKDNKLFSSIADLCSCGASTAPPATVGGRKRLPNDTTRASRARLSGAGVEDPEASERSEAAQASAAPDRSRAEQRAALMQEVAERLRARSKDVMNLLHVASMTLLLPDHVSVFLQSVETVELPDNDASGPSAGHAKHGEALQRMRTVIKLFKANAPLLLRHAGAELLALVQSGSTMQRAVALELAAGAAHHVQPLAVVGQERARVLATFEDVVANGSPKNAGHAVRAAHALLPAVARPAALERFLDGCERVMKAVGGADKPSALNAVHALSQISRIGPGLVAPLAADWLSWTWEEVMSSETAFDTLDDDTNMRAVKTTDAFLPWMTAPVHVHHKRALIAALSKGLLSATCNTRGNDHAQLEAALRDLTLRLYTVLDLEDGVSMFGMDGDVHAGLLRVAAASALLDIGIRQDALLPAHVYVALALVVQDPLFEVRNAFGSRVRSSLSACMGHLRENPHRVAKYLAFTCMAVVDPCRDHAVAMTRCLLNCLSTWRHWEASHSGGDAGEADTRDALSAKGTASHRCPEVLLFYLLYLIANHDDFPRPSEVAEVEGDSPLEIADDPLAPFESMLHVLVRALLDTSLDKAGTYNLLRAVSRAVGRLFVDASVTTAHSTGSLALLGDMALLVAETVAGPDVVAKAMGLPTPKVNVPVRLWELIDDPDAAAAQRRRKDGAATPAWFRVRNVASDLDVVFTKARAPATGAAGTKNRRASKRPPADAAAPSGGAGTSTKQAPAAKKAATAGRGAARTKSPARNGALFSAQQRQADDAQSPRPVRRSGRKTSATGARPNYADKSSSPEPRSPLARRGSASGAKARRSSQGAATGENGKHGAEAVDSDVRDTGACSPSATCNSSDESGAVGGRDATLENKKPRNELRSKGRKSGQRKRSAGVLTKSPEAGSRIRARLS